jgi:DNA-binding response OmpR family regulator
MRVLLLEDDDELAGFIKSGLERGGAHVVDRLISGKDALTAALTYEYDVIILDRMVPELDGLSVLKALVAAKSGAAILMLTSMADIESRVEGLEAGADDYLVKPFAFSELSARVAALSRRGRTRDAAPKTELTGGGIVLDLLGHSCRREDKPIDLSATEYRLLKYFMENAGKVLTKNMLLEHVWDMDFDPTTSMVETHISRLRSKLEKPFSTKVISTLKGAGYRFDA